MQAVGIGALVATTLYLWVLGGLLDNRPFSNFYDIQARALLHGHVDVPAGSLGIEAFVEGSRHYMYFPPGPAFLRMPIFAITDSLDGRLTPLSMLLA